MLRVPPEDSQDTVFLDPPYALLTRKVERGESLYVALAEFIEAGTSVFAESMDGHVVVLSARVSQYLPPRHRLKVGELGPNVKCLLWLDGVPTVWSYNLQKRYSPRRTKFKEARRRFGLRGLAIGGRIPRPRMLSRSR